MTNKMQLCRIIYYFLVTLHVSSDIFPNHQEHLICITVSGITHVCRCQPAAAYFMDKLIETYPTPGRVFEPGISVDLCGLWTNKKLCHIFKAGEERRPSGTIHEGQSQGRKVNV